MRLWLFIIIKFANCRCLVMSIISLVLIMFPLLSEHLFAHCCVTTFVDYFIIMWDFLDRLVSVASNFRAHVRIAGAESISFQTFWLVIHTIVRIVLPLVIIIDLLDVHESPFMMHDSTTYRAMLGVGALVRAC